MFFLFPVSTTRTMNRRPHPFVAAFAVLMVAYGMLPASRASAQTDASPDRGTAEPFVQVGKLVRLGQSRDGTPRFALMDDEGTITARVLPGAGVSPVRDVNQQVVVTAKSLKKGSDGLSYVLAQQISALDEDEDIADEVLAEEIAESDEMDETTADRMPLPARKTRKAANHRSLAERDDEPRILPDVTAKSLASEPPRARRSRYPDDDSALAGLRGARPSRVITAAAEEYEELVEPPVGVPMEDGVMDYGNVVEDPIGSPYEYGWDGMDLAGATSCGACNPCGVGCTACGPWGRRWIRAQYLLWTESGTSLPPLVTTSTNGTAVQDAGVLGLSTTDIIYGNGDILDSMRNGLRIQAGMWLDACQWWGLELDLFGMERGSDDFVASSEGSPILARPFYNALLNMEDAELVAYPGIVSGSVSVHTDSRLYWLAPRMRMNLRCADHLPYPALACGGCNPCGGAVCGNPGGYRVDLLVGYRFMRLDGSLQIYEQLTSRRDNNVSEFDLRDSFDTENSFNGFELGLSWDAYRGPWSLELLSLFMLGNNRRIVNIDGSTTSTTQGVSFTDPGGLLALSSNMGAYQDDEFVVIPELGATLGYAIAPNLRVLLGYTFLYWGNVVRPGDQIDLAVNPDLLPPEQATLGPAAPSFVLQDTTYWAQGLNVGLDWRW